MLIVLLDEMNLARTEYYFSEFLSRLELQDQKDEKVGMLKSTKSEWLNSISPTLRKWMQFGCSRRNEFCGSER